jgi:hypothetical protein
VGESLRSKAACSCSSSSSASSMLDMVRVDAARPSEEFWRLSVPRCIRTTSPLQMGQVRRRVVSHGVLYRLVSVIFSAISVCRLTCTLSGTRGHKAGSSRDSRHRYTPQDRRRIPSDALHISVATLQDLIRVSLQLKGSLGALPA